MAEFFFPGPIWFLAPKPPFYSMDELRGTILEGFFEDKTEGMVRAVFAFSDRDLAERFLEQAGEKSAPYSPLALPDDRLIDLLEGLQFHGHQYLSVDSEQTSTCLLPISGVIEQIRRRQAGPPPGHGAQG
jgi:hypothetical protein